MFSVWYAQTCFLFIFLMIPIPRSRVVNFSFEDFFSENDYCCRGIRTSWLHFRRLGSSLLALYEQYLYMSTGRWRSLLSSIFRSRNMRCLFRWLEKPDIFTLVSLQYCSICITCIVGVWRVVFIFSFHGFIARFPSEKASILFLFPQERCSWKLQLSEPTAARLIVRSTGSPCCARFPFKGRRETLH